MPKLLKEDEKRCAQAEKYFGAWHAINYNIPSREHRVCALWASQYDTRPTQYTPELIQLIKGADRHTPRSRYATPPGTNPTEHDSGFANYEADGMRVLDAWARACYDPKSPEYIEVLEWLKFAPLLFGNEPTEKL